MQILNQIVGASHGGTERRNKDPQISFSGASYHLRSLSCFFIFFVDAFGYSAVLFTPEGSAFNTRHLLALPIELFMAVYFYVPVTINVGLAFLSLLGVYALCFAGAWISRESLHDVVRKGFSRPFTKLFNNNLFAMPIIASMLLTAFFAITSFQESIGIPTGSLPERSPFETFFIGGTLVPLVEEIGFRISTIGVFLIAYLFLVGRKSVASWSAGNALKVALLIPLYPDKAKKLLGVKTVSEFGIRGISLAEWIIVIITSLVFGWVHVGHPWGPGKFTTTALDGLAFGLAYLLYGAQAPILLHWFVNYYWISYGLALDFYAFALPMYLIIFLVTIIVGMLGWSIFAGLLGFRVYGRVKSWWYKRWKKAVPPPPTPTQPPPPKPPPPIIRFCRQCGRVLSEDMRFCPYCGKALEEKRKEEAGRFV